MDFTDKTVIVTGAGAGLGRAMAIGFAADGANVIGMGRNAESLLATQGQCVPNRMTFVVGDVSKESDVAALLAEARKRFGRVDVLVNNAASYPKVPFIGTPFADWRSAIDTNVTGLALCCHAVLPGMLEQGYGRVLNVGTFAWLGPIPNSSAYSASKGAVRPFTKALASEIDSVRYPDVLVNEFIPGEFKTGMSDRGEDPAAVYPHVRFVAGLPKGGPSGETYFKSDLLRDAPGRRERVKALITKLTFGIVKI